jgi:hypothetical protein
MNPYHDSFRDYHDYFLSHDVLQTSQTHVALDKNECRIDRRVDPAKWLVHLNPRLRDSIIKNRINISKEVKYFPTLATKVCTRRRDG